MTTLQTLLIGAALCGAGMAGEPSVAPAVTPAPEAVAGPAGLLHPTNLGGFEAPGQWYRGNLHLHTTRSDGRFSPQEVVERYRGAGYDFIAITDHEANAGGAPVMDHPAASLTQGSFLVLPGGEYGYVLRGEMIHMCAVGPGYETQPSATGEPADALRTWWDRGAFAWFAHPYWSTDSTGLLEGMDFLPGLEVYNHTCEFWNGKGFSPAHWDRVLSLGRPLLGLAVDDAHEENGLHGGWVMVKSRELSDTSILAALRRGDFYASCGPTIESLAFDEANNLRIRCSPVKLIRVYSQWGGGTMVRAEEGRSLTEATLDLSWFWKTDYFTFARVECVDAEGRRAWSQAVLKKPAPQQPAE